MNDLNFQNFESVNSTNDQSGAFSGSIGDRRNLVGSGGFAAPDDATSQTTTRSGNFFSVAYYQQFFDVETDQVVKRVLNSVVPTHRNYITDFIQPIPDLWGPFWVSVTLVFSIGVFGNLAQFIENDGASGHYGSDFRMVTSASTLIFLYVVFVPMLLYGLMWYRRTELQQPYMDLVCLYGYSISIFIPVSLLWIVDLNWFRWALILVSVSLSGSVLVRALWPSFQNDNKAVAYGAILGVVLLHFLLAFSFKEFYFDSMHPKSAAGPAGPAQLPAAPPIPHHDANGSEKDPPVSQNLLNSQLVVTEKETSSAVGGDKKKSGDRLKADKRDSTQADGDAKPKVADVHQQPTNSTDPSPTDASHPDAQPSPSLNSILETLAQKALNPNSTSNAEAGKGQVGGGRGGNSTTEKPFVVDENSGSSGSTRTEPLADANTSTQTPSSTASQPNVTDLTSKAAPSADSSPSQPASASPPVDDAADEKTKKKTKLESNATAD